MIKKFDNFVLMYIKDKMHRPIMDKIMKSATGLGNGGAVWIIIALILLYNKPYRLIGNIVLFTLIISTILGEGIVKHIVRRTRPCDKEKTIKLLISKPISYSFPSGHTLSSFAVASVLSEYFTSYKAIFLLIALLIAFSRLYLYVHYPTDVIAGIIFGILCSRLIFIILQGGYFQKYMDLCKRLI